MSTKLNVSSEDERSEVEIVSEGKTLTAIVDGRRHVIEVSEPEPNIFLIKENNKVFEAHVSPDSSQANTFDVQVGSHGYRGTVSDPKRLRGSAASADHAGGPAELRTSMPGKVVRILVAKGEDVTKGDTIMVVEAMKMQNEMKSPKDGVVKEIRVAENDTVGAGDILALVE